MDEKNNIPEKKKQPDVKAIEDQAFDVIKDKDFPDLEQVEVPEDLKKRLKDADSYELDVIEKELGIENSQTFEEELSTENAVVEGAQIEEFHVESDDSDTLSSESPTDGRCEIRISDDRMSAEVDFYPSDHGGAPLTYEYVSNELERLGVVFGVNQELLKKIIQNVEKTKDIKNGVIIAQGTLPEEGEDGRIEYHFSDDESVFDNAEDGDRNM